MLKEDDPAGSQFDNETSIVDMGSCALSGEVGPYGDGHSSMFHTPPEAYGPVQEKKEGLPQFPMPPLIDSKDVSENTGDLTSMPTFPSVTMPATMLK